MACSNLDCLWGMRTNVCVRLDCRTPPPPRLYHGRRPLFPHLKGPGAGRGRDCCGVTHQLALTLPHQQSTAGIFNTLAGWLPLSAKRPVRTEILALHESISKPLPRRPEGVGPSKPRVPNRVASNLRTPRSNATYQNRTLANQTRLPTNPRTVLHNPHPTPESTGH